MSMGALVLGTLLQVSEAGFGALGPVTVRCESYERLISVIQGLHNYNYMVL